MARDDGAEAKVAAAVAVTAAIFSPRVRELLRLGAVHGLAGVLTAGDALAAFARGVSRGIQDSPVTAPPVVPSASVATEPLGGDAGAPLRRTRTRSSAQRKTARPTGARPNTSVAANTSAKPSEGSDA